MKRILLFVFVCCTFNSFGQTIYDWGGCAPDGNWRQGAFGARWFGGTCSSGCFDEPGFGILSFNNTNQPTMVNNVSGIYSMHQIVLAYQVSKKKVIL
jgi:hypothetical protein